ncbi:hypothetical protein U1Q18_002945 [Sarracenia purpurea var. burkii]
MNSTISTILKSNFKPYGRDFNDGEPTGRFSNGRIPTDFISEAFGLKPTVPAYVDPVYNITDFASGICFASAGTCYDNATLDSEPKDCARSSLIRIDEDRLNEDRLRSEKDRRRNDGNGAKFLEMSDLEVLQRLKLPKIVWSSAEQQFAVKGLQGFESFIVEGHFL